MELPKDPMMLFSFKTHPVRFLSMSNDGTLCYGYDGEIYTQQEGSNPRKINVEIIRDDQPQIAYLKYPDKATSATVSPDGKQIAFTVRGEVFVTSADYATTKQITHTAAEEDGLSFAPDNRTLAYASERNGNWQIYLAKIVREEDPNFPKTNSNKARVISASSTLNVHWRRPASGCPEQTRDHLLLLPYV